MIRREQWNAAPNRGSPALVAPSEIFLHHAVDGSPCYDVSEARSRVRNIQRMHQDTNGWTDIAYSVLVDSAGHQFEGRRRDGVTYLETMPGATKDHNARSLAICLLGHGGEGAWTSEAAAGVCAQVDAIRARWGNLPLRSHRDVNATACPGEDAAQWVAAGSDCTDSPTPPTAPPKPGEPGLADELKHWRPNQTRNLRIQPGYLEGPDVAEFQYCGNLTVADPNTHGAEQKWTAVDGVYGPDSVRLCNLIQTYGRNLGLYNGTIDGIAGTGTRHVVVVTLNTKRIWPTG